MVIDPLNMPAVTEIISPLAERVGAGGAILYLGSTVGRIRGVTEFDADDESDAPAKFIAFKYMVYKVPFVKPVIINGLLVCAELVKVAPPSIEYK